tara:strand:+ start:602 stop:772 length:171 start_codon:yes stop_codon:yes gene_type:complete
MWPYLERMFAYLKMNYAFSFAVKVSFRVSASLTDSATIVSVGLAQPIEGKTELPAI